MNDLYIILSTLIFLNIIIRLIHNVFSNVYRDKEEMNDLFKETEDKIFEVEREIEETHLHFDFKQDVETQQRCYELLQQKQELDRLILINQLEKRNDEIKEKYKRCPNCGANLQYKNGIAKCKYCDSEWGR